MNDDEKRHRDASNDNKIPKEPHIIGSDGIGYHCSNCGRPLSKGENCSPCQIDWVQKQSK